MQLNGTTVLVTGATGGIGAAIARELSRRGAHPIVTGRDEDRCRRLADELDTKWLAIDLAGEPDGPETLARGAGPVDAVVHAAGAGLLASFATTDPPDIERLVTLNLTAPLQLTRAVLPEMSRRGHGHVAFIGSIAGLTGVADETVYSATKAGLLTFADALRLELRGSGVSVSWISPAAVATGFWSARGGPYERTFPRPVTAARIAALCVDDIEGGRARRITPGWLGAAPAVRAVAPRMYDRLAAWMS